MKRTLKFLLLAPLMASTLFVAAQSNIVLIRKVGEFGNKPGQFKFPAMIAADHAANVYVVDQHNHRIQKFDSAGNFILMWGKAGTGAGEFNYPYGIAVDSKNNVYVSDMNNNRIQKFSPQGVFLREVGSYGTGDSQLKYPYGMSVDREDFLYVIDAFNYKIKKFDANLKFVSQWGSPESIGIKLYMPHEIVVNEAGDIILSDRQNHRISVFSNGGELKARYGEYGEGREITGGLFSEPHGIALNERGELLVCDRYNFRVQKFSPRMKFQGAWLTSAIFEDSRYFPLGIATAKNGLVYVTDHYAHTVHLYRVFDSDQLTDR